MRTELWQAGFRYEIKTDNYDNYKKFYKFIRTCLTYFVLYPMLQILSIYEIKKENIIFFACNLYTCRVLLASLKNIRRKL